MRLVSSYVRRLELAAVAVLLWNWWRVLSATGFRFFVRFFFPLRTHTAYGMNQAALPHISLY